MSTKRTLVALSAVALLGMGSSGLCSCSSSQEALSSKSTSAAANGVTTVSTADNSGGHVVIEVTSDAMLKHYYTSIDELNKATDVDAIVRGVIAVTRDVYESGLAYRVLTVDVTESYKGEPAHEITVYEDGGVVPLKEALPDMAGHYDPASLSEKDVESGLVDFKFMGADHSQVGDKVILYMRKNPNPSQGGSYQLIMSVFSRFKLNEATSMYVRPAMEGAADFESTMAKDVMETALDKLKSQ